MEYSKKKGIKVKPKNTKRSREYREYRENQEIQGNPGNTENHGEKGKTKNLKENQGNTGRTQGNKRTNLTFHYNLHSLISRGGGANFFILFYLEYDWYVYLFPEVHSSLVYETKVGESCCLSHSPLFSPEKKEKSRYVVIQNLFIYIIVSNLHAKKLFREIVLGRDKKKSIYLLEN